jgi:hypothetical protein
MTLYYSYDRAHVVSWATIPAFCFGRHGTGWDGWEGGCLISLLVSLPLSLSVFCGCRRIYLQLGRLRRGIPFKLGLGDVTGRWSKGLRHTLLVERRCLRAVCLTQAFLIGAVAAVVCGINEWYTWRVNYLMFRVSFVAW